ncbi:hypothetical protein Y032_0614g682 [Ancylostoma ceylanicum]|uniref:Uncharacterized protein n=1 Tax=Ancylostoma ceylanicum TaxID=53326 RepID=A0A016WM87_9BILA|nr:hypothetical protein Y032_0614g682 [Ancylostoma ceylanicum]
MMKDRPSRIADAAQTHAFTYDLAEAALSPHCGCTFHVDQSSWKSFRKRMFASDWYKFPYTVPVNHFA